MSLEQVGSDALRYALTHLPLTWKSGSNTCFDNITHVDGGRGPYFLLPDFLLMSKAAMASPSQSSDSGGLALCKPLVVMQKDDVSGKDQLRKSAGQFSVRKFGAVQDTSRSWPFPSP